MNTTRIAQWLRRDGWLLAVMLLSAAVCIALGASGSDGASEEDRISRVLSAMAGAGSVEVAVHMDGDAPAGAVIIAEGANDVSVRLRLTSALATLLGLDAESIAVFPARSASP